MRRKRTLAGPNLPNVHMVHPHWMEALPYVLDESADFNVVGRTFQKRAQRLPDYGEHSYQDGNPDDDARDGIEIASDSSVSQNGSKKND
jgi:hypothetical protein